MEVPGFIPEKYKQIWTDTFNAIYSKKDEHESFRRSGDIYDDIEVKAYRIACGRVKAEVIREFSFNMLVNTPMPMEYISTWDFKDEGITKAKPEDKQVNFNFKKSNVDIGLGVIYGIASKADVVDQEDEIIELIDLKMAAHEFMSESRNGDIDHDWKNHGDVVESLVMDKAFIDMVKSGEIAEGDWFIGYKPNDQEVAKKAASGEDFNGFSIGGICRRVIERGDDSGSNKKA